MHHRCASCGMELPEEAKFCPKCGVAVAENGHQPRYKKTTREFSRNFATTEARRAILDDEVDRYQEKGWTVITLSETKARIYKGRYTRDIAVGLDGRLSDEFVQDYRPEGSSDGHTLRNWLLGIGGLVLLLLIVGAVGLINSSGGEGRPCLTGGAKSPSGLVGIGAADSVWNSRHRVVLTGPRGNKYNPCAVYDPLPYDNNRFIFVQHQNGVVIQFFMMFPDAEGSIEVPNAGESVDQVKQASAALIPPDARVLFDGVRVDCEVIGMQSAVLGTVFRRANISDPDGYFALELSSPDIYKFDPSHVVQVVVSIHGSGTEESDVPC